MVRLGLWRRVDCILNFSQKLVSLGNYIGLCWMKNKLTVHNQKYRRYRMECNFRKHLKQNAGCISWCTRCARRPHAEKLLSTTLHTPNLAEIWKILCLDPSRFVCQLYCCSSKHSNNKALRITFSSCKTVSTSNMALATVNIKSLKWCHVILCIRQEITT